MKIMFAKQEIPDAGPGIDWIALAAVLITVAFWASSFVMIRICLGPLSPVQLATARYVSAGVLAIIYLVAVRPMPAKRDFIRLTIAAVLFIAAYSVLLNTGEQSVPAGPASFIINTMPVFTALIASVALKEKFGTWGWIGTAISFCGVGLIAMASGQGYHFDPNALLILGAALCSAVASVLQKPVLGRLPALAVTAWVLLIGCLPLLPALPSTLHAVSAAPSAVKWGIAYLAIFPTAIGYLTWAIALKRLTATRASNFLYSVPPTATLLGFLFLGESLTLIGAVGGLLAISGVLVVNVMRLK